MGFPSFSVLDSVLPGHDLAEHSPLRGQIAAQEGGHVLPGDGVEHLGEAEGIIAVEIPLRQGHGDVLKGVQPPEVGAEGRPAHPLVIVLVDALRCQALRLPLDLSGSPAGVAYMLIASVIFALAGPWNKAVTQKVDSFTVSCLNLGVGGAALLVIGLVLGGSLHPQSFGAVPVLLFLAFISGAGYVIWALLMKNNPVSRIAVFGLIIPIMNVLLSAILNGEPLFEWQYLAALVLVCGGIYLVNRPAAGKKKEN